MNFADTVTARIKKTKSVLCAGIDPSPEHIPEIFLKEGGARAFSLYCETACESVAEHAAVVKPNAAFFEQYGLKGLQALSDLCVKAKELDVPIIIDAKRGDIGNTSAAYAKAYLGSTTLFGETIHDFSANALTVHPFHGLESIEPFALEAERNGCGIFVLVQTSNPGASLIQGAKTMEQRSVSETLAQWINERGKKLIGTSGFSSLGAVIGATYPEEALALRKLMPHALFLIPGYGAQGGSAKDAVASIKNGGGIVNASRGIFALKGETFQSIDEFKSFISKKAEVLAADLRSALSA